VFALDGPPDDLDESLRSELFPGSGEVTG
jgi:hypothetical protein